MKKIAVKTISVLAIVAGFILSASGSSLLTFFGGVLIVYIGVLGFFGKDAVLNPDL